jgi:hypothetical protein
MHGFFDDAQKYFSAVLDLPKTQADIRALAKSARGLPQTQEDIRILAETAKRYENVDVQREIEQGKAEFRQYAKIQLGVQVAGVVLLGGVLLYLVSRRRTA